MDLSSLIKECDRLRPQIAAERDPVLRREMQRTFKHFQKQIRSATKYRSQWYGVKFHLLFLTVVFGGMVYCYVRLEKEFGWVYALTSVIVVFAALVLITAMIFLVVRIISPENYMSLVKLSFESVQRLWGVKSGTDAKSPLIRASHPDKASMLPPNPTNPQLGSGDPSPTTNVPPADE